MHSVWNLTPMLCDKNGTTHGKRRTGEYKMLSFADVN